MAPKKWGTSSQYTGAGNTGQKTSKVSKDTDITKGQTKKITSKSNNTTFPPNTPPGFPGGSPPSGFDGRFPSAKFQYIAEACPLYLNEGIVTIHKGKLKQLVTSHQGGGSGTDQGQGKAGMNLGGPSKTSLHKYPADDLRYFTNSWVYHIDPPPGFNFPSSFFNNALQYGDAGYPESQYRKIWFKNGINQEYTTGKSYSTPKYNLLATHSFTTSISVSPLLNKLWDNLKTHVESYDADKTNLQVHFDIADDTFNSAIKNSIVPHSHTCLVDKDGNGFTIMTHLAPDYDMGGGVGTQYGKDFVNIEGAIAYHVHEVKNWTILSVESEIKPPDWYSPPEFGGKGVAIPNDHQHAGLFAPGPDNLTPINRIRFLEMLDLHVNNPTLNSMLSSQNNRPDPIGTGVNYFFQHNFGDGSQGANDAFDDTEAMGGATPAQEWIRNANIKLYDELHHLIAQHRFDFFNQSGDAKLSDPGPGVPQQYQDYAFNLCFPYNIDDMLKLPPENKATSVRLQFNYTMEFYEKALEKIDRSIHGFIPNIYLLASYDEKNSKFLTTGSPGSITDLGHILCLGNDTPLVQSFEKFVSTEEYFFLWSQTIQNNQVPFGKLDPNKMIFPSTYYFDKYATERTKFLYPWLTELRLELPTNSDTPLFDIFNGPGGLDIPEAEEIPATWLMKYIIEEAKQDSYKQKIFQKVGSETREENYATWDLTEIFQNPPHVAAHHEQTLPSKTMLFDNPIQEIRPNKGTNCATLFKLASTFEQAREIMREKTRSLIEIFNAEQYGTANLNGLAHSEIMFYKITKKMHGGGLGADTVQQFYIAPPFEKNFLELFDTQLKFDTSYEYDVDAFVMVIGNKYNYIRTSPQKLRTILSIDGKTDIVGEVAASTLLVDKVEQAEWRFDVESGNNYEEVPIARIMAINEPSIKLIRIPYSRFATIHVSDYPPVEPNVEIRPYKNINNKLLFWFNSSAGERDDVPISILPTDPAIWAEAQKGETPGTIHFKSDEAVKKYQIFKIDKKPTSYGDFANGLIELPEGRTDFVDTSLVPNKKYYYTFRAVDSHKWISNPTPVYEVEIADNDGAIYPVIKIINLESSTVLKEQTKAMSKYIHIVPTLKQGTISTQDAETAVLAYPKLGDLFGNSFSPRKFKIRLTSKSSGKKLDLNLNFVQTNKSDYMPKNIKPGIPKEVIIKQGQQENYDKAKKSTLDAKQPTDTKAFAKGGGIPAGGMDSFKKDYKDPEGEEGKAAKSGKTEKKKTEGTAAKPKPGGLPGGYKPGKFNL